MSPASPEWLSGIDRAEVVEAVGTCHLVDAPDTWPRGGPSRAIFDDDDLGVDSVGCSCGVLYLKVSRRVPRDMWYFLIPVEPCEIAVLIAQIAEAQQSYTGRWRGAEAGVVALTSTRPFLERSYSSPAILRWSGPGTPLAFTVAPC